uniref:Peroxisomal membrane protein 4 n=1 Tax=Zonotrichia albicollis TaxID=44394 RepID=A0A8D2ND96_ZONAL
MPSVGSLSHRSQAQQSCRSSSASPGLQGELEAALQLSPAGTTVLGRFLTPAKALYGAKIRAPHALVMTFLFKSGSFREKLKSIAQATYAHSRNLAYFVFTYKGLLAAQSQLQGKKIPFHSFLAACIGGWLVFGDNNPINSQIIMYLLSRILFGLSRLAVQKGFIPQPRQDPFPLLAALVWGTVLWLFEYHRDTLQPSLQSSMTYLYEDSEVWHDVSDFLIYNKRTHSK